MSPVLREYVLKGLYLGLWAYMALVHPAWDVVGKVLLWTTGGLAIGLLAGVGRQLLLGYRPGKNPFGFLLLVLLDNPFFIYLGLIGGLGLGLVIETDPPEGRNWLGYCALAGGVLGYGFFQLRQVKDWMWRFGLGAAVAAASVYLTISYIGELDDLRDAAALNRLGQLLLLAVPFFYLLTFCGEAEESEIEIAVLCALMGISFYLQGLFEQMPGIGSKVVFLFPIALYFVYSTRWLHGLRVFKHTLRGYGSLSLGRVREALTSFGRALQLDKKNELAKRGLYELHRRVDVTTLDPQTLGLLNFEFCLTLANDYLIRDRAPTEKERIEAMRLLDLVSQQRPALQPNVDYLKAVALVHAKDYDRAAGYLSRLLDPTIAVERPDVRKKVLLAGWDLALRLHPEMVARLGENEIAKPGRRMDAIAAVERQLAKEPTDPTAGELRTFLYSTLTESEFLAAGEVSSDEFNFDYVEQLGLALTAAHEAERIDRGMAYLRIAGRGLPARGPGIFRSLADIAESRGHIDEARGYLEQVKRAGLLVTPNRLAADQLATYLQTLKKLVDDDTARGDFEAAVGDLRLYIECGKEDVNTLRQLADLHAKSGDLLNAVLIVERGLLYSKADPDLLKKKESYYYSVDLERVRSVREKIAPWFDTTYCLTQARKVADMKEPDLETIEWGMHLTSLARAIHPKQHSAMLVEARLLMRVGKRDEALSLLEDIREQPRGSGDEEDAWFQTVRILGDIYLDELDRPELAIGCYKDFREYQKSGADSIYQLARAYEATGDMANAIRSYEIVAAYTKHPRYYDATEAVRRLKGTT